MDLRERFEAFLTVLPDELAYGEEDPGSVLDRYYVPGFEYHNDGITLDRQRLIDHVRPVRRNLVSSRIEVGDVLVGEDRASARYTVHSVLRKGKVLTLEVYLFAAFAPDGRVSRVDSITRLVEESGNA
ncbi:nuclear transport factor 2 family protein [Nonomuraea sp. LPB2021202275-12-8]|uniref:nuclear transport factor 2 family protein n=1 Tax=Nonomuraea sp. LPB2021202275-12-8 TaxID=3120159 RepID=UPI00300C47E5